MIDQDGKLIARPQPDPIQALREIAPKLATHITFDIDGTPCWQDHLGSGRLWAGEGWHQYSNAFPLFNPEMRGTAINLRTHSVYLQQTDGTVVEVTRGEWEKMP